MTVEPKYPPPRDPLEQTFADMIVRGCGLRINCRTCGFYASWTDKDLVERFILCIDTPMIGLREKMKCPTCKKPVQIAGYNAHRTVTWRAQGLQSDEGRLLMERDAELREWAADAVGKAEQVQSYAAAKRRL